MSENPDDGGGSSFPESAGWYEVGQAAERAWYSLGEANRRLATGADAADGSVRRDVELAVIFYRDLLFDSRDGGGEVSEEVAALQECGLQLAEVVGSDVAKHLFQSDRWNTPAAETAKDYARVRRSP